ncbi:hypothetical protein N0V83_002147 [Neocucurbitaria cava]|uniref:Uncharacterized protein n=1 Tax=Neocucurbitaria cava TaxID=798079 RepID=A0A9W9CQI9_9PLEO|nr:hypothetical protein N0V83_002147 [Neocucurbitaria cava]
MSTGLPELGFTYLAASKICFLAGHHFEEEFNAVPDANNIAWEVQDHDTATYFEQTIPIGHVKLYKILWKVSAYMVRRTGAIHLCLNGARLIRSHTALVQLSSPFLHLQKEGEGLHLEQLEVLCQLYFLSAEYVMGLKVKNKWFESLKLAFEAVGQGMGTLEKPVGAVAWADEEGEMDC